MKIIANLIILFFKIFRRLLMYLFLMKFKKTGKNIIFSPFDFFSYSNIELGDDVSISPGAHFSTIKKIKIGSKVMFGPNVTIIGGDHNHNQIGKYMFDVDVKLPENDKDIIIEDDVWIGTSAIILKGVTISRGSIIGAGSIVTKDIPEYSIAIGSPAKVIRKRFNESDLENHKNILGKI